MFSGFDPNASESSSDHEASAEAAPEAADTPSTDTPSTATPSTAPANEPSTPFVPTASEPGDDELPDPTWEAYLDALSDALGTIWRRGQAFRKTVGHARFVSNLVIDLEILWSDWPLAYMLPLFDAVETMIKTAWWVDEEMVQALSE